MRTGVDKPNDTSGTIAPSEVLLAIDHVVLSFGGVKAIRDVSFDIRKGEVRAIIGPNGAGKTSMLNVINGFYHPQTGTITYKGDPRQRHREVVEKIIDFLEIQAIRKTPVGKLPYGLQKRVELGRALATEPELLLLDEPMAGMNLEEKQDMSRFIIDINQQLGTTMALIEHDMGVVMDLSDRVAVLEYGQLIADGTPDEVQKNQRVIDAYLGVSH